MPGKSKDCKANKGRKALQSEWEDAVSAAVMGDPLIASAVNVVKREQSGGPSCVYVAQSAGGNAKDRLRKYEEAIALAERERERKTAEEFGTLSLQEIPGREGGAELNEKGILKAKKKKEKEDAKAFEQKAEQERSKRAAEKEEKMRKITEVGYE